jgi:HAD superfamily hydrolase (TIGR01509 family)
MDGVLVDSEPLWALAEIELLARHGDQFTAADAESTHGRSIEETVAAYALRLGGVDAPSLRAELVTLMRGHYEDGVPVRPGARELIRSLQGRLPLAVASNTDGDLVRLALERAGLDDAFTAIVTGADVGRGKPHPDVYITACRLLGVEPRDAVAFEDSPPGVQAAKAAGMTCVGIPERDGVDLTTDGADLVVGSLAELVDQAPTRVGSAGPGMIRSNC